MAKKKLSKTSPTSSQVHVPVPLGEQKKPKKMKKTIDDRKGDDTREVGKVVIFRNGKMLLGRRSDNDHYDFPGGRMKFGEDVNAGTIREVHEETGIELDPKGLIPLGFDSRETNDKDKTVEVSVFAADLDACPPLSETEDRDEEMGALEWIDVSEGIPQDVLANMHLPIERNIVLQCMKADGAPEKTEENKEPNALSDLQDAQELVSGIDWEIEQQNVGPDVAREMAWDNLERDPLYYRKKRLMAEGTSDELAKDTGENEESQFTGEGYSPDAIDTGFWLDLGSHNCRESGHLGLDLYPYDYGTAVHDLDTGLPFPDASASRVRMSNVLGDESLSDPKALLSEIHRVLMPGGQFIYEGPEDIHNYPNWVQDYPGLVLTDHEDSVSKDGGKPKPLFRQEFTRIATPDPATANDAEPRVGVAQYDMLPADAILAVDATSYLWSDSTSSGRGNRLMGYPSQGGLLNKGMEGSASSATESNHLLHEEAMFKGGPGSGRHPEGGDLRESTGTKEKLQQVREAYLNSKGKARQSLHGQLQRAILDHQQAAYRDSAHERGPYNNHMVKSIEKQVPILKMGMKQVVYCVVLEPDTVDSQDDIISAEDIEQTAHNYLINARVIGSGHEKPIDAVPVESFIAPQDLQYDGPNGPQIVKKGSWVIGIKVLDPAEWEKVVNGEYGGVSVGGEGMREEL